MRQDIILNLQKQSISFKLASHFQSIVLIDIFSNIKLLGDGPKGLRFILKNDANQLDCFCWQTPGELSFNYFNIMNLLNEVIAETLFNELIISCEGFEFSSSTEINISLDISDNNRISK